MYALEKIWSIINKLLTLRSSTSQLKYWSCWNVTKIAQLHSIISWLRRRTCNPSLKQQKFGEKSNMVTCIQASLNWFFLRTVALAFLKLLRVVPFKTVFFFNGKQSTACSLVFGKVYLTNKNFSSKFVIHHFEQPF